MIAIFLHSHVFHDGIARLFTAKAFLLGLVVESSIQSLFRSEFSMSHFVLLRSSFLVH